jgi:molecular chaperone DnaJ
MSFFQRDGADLYCKVPISMTTAALRRTVRGRVARRFANAGEGAGRHAERPPVPAQGQGHACAASAADRRPLHPDVAIETPQNLSKRQRELLEEFDKLSSKENSPQSSGFFSRMKEFLRVVRGIAFLAWVKDEKRKSDKNHWERDIAACLGGMCCYVSANR